MVRVANTYDQTNTIAYDPLGREIQRVLACATTVERAFRAAFGRESPCGAGRPPLDRAG